MISDELCVDSPHKDGMIEYFWIFGVRLTTSNDRKSRLFCDIYIYISMD